MAKRTEAARPLRRVTPKKRSAPRPPTRRASALQETMLPAPPGAGTGSLIIIGGREDKEGDKAILREVSSRVESGKLVVATVAILSRGDRYDLDERRPYTGSMKGEANTA